MRNRNTIPGKDKYLQLSELGSGFNLSFSSQVTLGNKIIALDGRKKKLLVASLNDDLKCPYIVELDKVKAISVIKIYGSIKPGELVKKKFNEFLKSIHLQFEFQDQREVYVLPFYERDINNVQNLSTLEKNAKNWQLIRSKMIVPKKNEVIAEKQPPSRGVRQQGAEQLY